MKSLLLSAYNELLYTDMPDPEVLDDDVLIRVMRCGICGSDVHGMDGSSGRRIPPIVMGHEASGVVEAIGSAVRGVGVGDRVTFDSTVFCGKCDYCRSGRLNLCESRQVLGVSCDEYRRHGAFAEHISVPVQTIYKLADNITFDQAALVEPLSIAMHAVEISDSVFGRRVGVIGAGVIGSFLISVLKAAGVSECIAIDPDPSRRDRGVILGADYAFDPGDGNFGESDLIDAIGGPVDIVFEAVGLPVTVSSAISIVRKGGSVVLVGNITPVVNINLQYTVTRELKILGSCGSAGEYDMCLSMFERGLINDAAIISEIVPLSDGAEWFRRLYKGEAGLLKVLLSPNA